MNIEQETIAERIKNYQVEMACLQQNHDAMVARFNQEQATVNQRVQANQNRFQQISGALIELELLNQQLAQKNGEVETDKERNKK